MSWHPVASGGSVAVYLHVCQMLRLPVQLHNNGRVLMTNSVGISVLKTVWMESTILVNRSG
jgi:hypothetical protein